eukprot:CAMPEP_0174234212 /NCGR_PEP_ID=MMETSP0417-20130205/4031_1 /TAXON_ID=242541 /ORGANISM="Mayorella sp, Strain BSH-02190019" /LENGTH=160 /DNA_ID=CAMNT_0015312545 /DNA_START=227 /DNA_END=709 /DNA_ORIENTATION=+
MVDKFTGHWYPENPSLASGYRAIMVDNSHGIVDSLFEAPAGAAAITDIEDRAPDASITMWIDPGCVFVRNHTTDEELMVYEMPALRQQYSAGPTGAITSHRMSSALSAAMASAAASSARSPAPQFSMMSPFASFDKNGPISLTTAPLWQQSTTGPHSRSL